MVLLLLLRIGSVAACTQHELADVGMGAPDSALVEKAASDADDGGLAAHAASCTHCSCHHAAAVLLSVSNLSAVANTPVYVDSFDERASAPLPLTLRPPIA